jgi:hypothetical protein
VLEARGALDLTLESLGAETGRELGMEHLERHRPVVPEVIGYARKGSEPGGNEILNVPPPG